LIWQYQIYTGSLLLASLIVFILLHSGWQFRNTSEGKCFTLLMASLFIWTVLQFLEVIFQDPFVKIWLSKISYIGIVNVGPLFFLFILTYTQQIKKWKILQILALWIIPVTVLLLAITNEWHHLIWPNIIQVQIGFKTYLTYQHGFIVYLLAAYSYLALFFSAISLIYYMKQVPKEARSKIYFLLIGAFFPLIGSVLYLGKGPPFPGMDLTPFSFLLTGIFISISVFRFQLLDIIPIALDVLFTSMTKGVIAIDLNNRVVAINPSAEKIFQIHSIVIGQKVWEAFQGYPEFGNQFHLFVSENNEFEIENPKRNGWLNVRISPIIDSKKNYKGRLITLEDITTRKRTEKNLQESKERFEQVAEQAREIIWEIDTDGLYTYISPRIESIVGYKPEEIVGKMHYYELHPAEQRQSIREEAKKIFQEKGIFRDYVSEVETKEGKRLFFSTNGVPILNDQGELLGYRGSDYDITILKKMEQVKDEFISTVSHELRTPLTIIKESINIVLNEYTGPLNLEQKESLMIGKRNVDRLSRLINDVLDFQKIQFEGFSMNLQPENINLIAKEFQITMLSIAREKGLDLRLELDVNLPDVMLDKDRIIQVLTNLINNAFKFTENGYVLIRTEPYDDSFIKVTIQDTGIGIALENIEKLFQRFSQVAPFELRKSGSTGLGLAICKEIIEKHHGKIWVESELGKGSSFCFTLLLSSVIYNSFLRSE